MKTSLIIISFSVASLCMSFDQPKKLTTSVKNEPVITKQSNGFDFVRLHRQGPGVTATWAMTAASEVVGFVVQRTYEDPTDPYAAWEDITTVPCNSSRSYRHNDMEVFPGEIHYRVVALKDDGQTITSEIAGIRIKSRR